VHKRVGVYGPDDLKTLQQIFDSVWLQLERIGRVHTDDEHVRLWISSRVLACAKERDVLDFDSIKRAVLNSLYN
jgi:hypothetical protein